MFKVLTPISVITISRLDRLTFMVDFYMKVRCKESLTEKAVYEKLFSALLREIPKVTDYLTYFHYNLLTKGPDYITVTG